MGDRGEQTMTDAAQLFSDAERWESLKVAAVSAIATGLAWILTTFANGFIPAELLPSSFTDEIGLLRGAIALFSGALFGITYRYAIRTDNHAPLQGGVVAAFGLVRGLVIAEQAVRYGDVGWHLGIVVLEAILWFAIAATAIQTGFAMGWLKPFGLPSSVD